MESWIWSFVVTILSLVAYWTNEWQYNKGHLFSITCRWGHKAPRLDMEDFTAFDCFGFNKLPFCHLLKLHHSCFSQHIACVLVNWAIWHNPLLALLKVSVPVRLLNRNRSFLCRALILEVIIPLYENRI